MSAILYPVASSAEQALNRPLGRAVREGEARRCAGDAVTFVQELAGPGFSTREAALAAYAGRLDEAGVGSSAAPEDRYCRLVEVLAPGAKAPAERRPTLREGRRWPDPPKVPPTVWRISVAYWRIGRAEAAPAPQARSLRKAGADLDAQALLAIARAPLRPVRPQKALDIGLFEVRPPEAPHIVMPDE
jgi:hypothetical protein